MAENIKKNIPCFTFVPGLDALWEAVCNLGLRISPIVITHKDSEIDYEAIIQSTEDLLMQNSLHVNQQVVDNIDGYELSTILHHGLSGQKYDLRESIKVNKNDAFDFELSVRFLKIKSYIHILGLPIIDASSYFLPLDKKIEMSVNISYSDIRMFLECKRCFYLAKKFHIKPAYDEDKFTVSNANDGVLKDEFDKCRQARKPHPLMSRNEIDAIPFDHKDVFLWKNSDFGRGGIKLYDAKRNFVFGGVIDDIWQNQQGKLNIVDYKTTSKHIFSMDSELGFSYRRQISFYSWLFQKNGFPMHSVGYLILDKPHISKYSYSDMLFNKCSREEYVFNPHSDVNEYKRFLKFETRVLEVKIDYSWIEETLDNITDCLSKTESPKITKNPRTGRVCSNCEIYGRQKNYDDWLIKQKNVSIATIV